MATCMEDLAPLLNLPPNVHIIESSLSPLMEASGISFSSSLSQLKVRWKTDPDLCSEEEGSGVAVQGTATIEQRRGNKSRTETKDLETEVAAEGYGELDLIVKCMPDPRVWVSLNSEVTFEKELNMYSLLVPQYLTILRELTANPDSKCQPLFPKFYGGRLNLENRTDHVDENAVIVLENLKLSGYENCRHTKLNGYHFTQVLERLALFHSVGIIIQHNPVYKGTLKDLLETSKSFFFGAKDKNIEQINAERRAKTMDIVKKFKYEQNVNERLMNILIQTDNKTLPATQTSYYTLIHNDLWINNIMFKYGSSSDEILDLKFIDFQNTNFGSIAKELIFLLYTSVEWSVWNDLDSYIQHYHKCLIHNLSKHSKSNNIIIGEFSLEKLRTELKTYACHKLKHIFIIMNITHGHDPELYAANLKQILDNFIENNFL